VKRWFEESLDSALKERVRAVVDRQPVTEAELRTLAEEGRACLLILNAQLVRNEQRLAELSSDPSSSLAEMAVALRNVNELRPDVEELETLLAELQERAREYRATWLSSTGAGAPT
jgi:chromosome segregation ATPase